MSYHFTVQIRPVYRDIPPEWNVYRQLTEEGLETDLQKSLHVGHGENVA